jgi:hypothetical protein
MRRKLRRNIRRSRRRKTKLNTEKRERRTYNSERDKFCIRLLCVPHLLVHSLSFQSQGPVGICFFQFEYFANKCIHYSQGQWRRLLTVNLYPANVENCVSS